MTTRGSEATHMQTRNWRHFVVGISQTNRQLRICEIINFLLISQDVLLPSYRGTISFNKCWGQVLPFVYPPVNMYSKLNNLLCLWYSGWVGGTCFSFRKLEIGDFGVTKMGRVKRKCYINQATCLHFLRSLWCLFSYINYLFLLNIMVCKFWTYTRWIYFVFQISKFEWRWNCQRKQ